jgi:hypothetical protein
MIPTGARAVKMSTTQWNGDRQLQSIIDQANGISNAIMPGAYAFHRDKAAFETPDSCISSSAHELIIETSNTTPGETHNDNRDKSNPKQTTSNDQAPTANCRRE